MSNVGVYTRLLSYLKPYWKAALLVILGFILNALTEVSIAKLMQFIIDAINHKNRQYIDWFPLLIVLLFAVRGTASFLGNYYLAYISRHLVYSLRKQLFEHILRLPARFYQQYSSGHLSAKIIFNVEQVTGAATDALRVIVRDGLIVVGLLSWLFYVNWRLTLCLLVVAPLIALVVKRASSKMKQYSADVQESMGDVGHITQESIAAHQVVKHFSAEAFESERFDKASKENLEKGMKIIVTSNINTPLVQFLMAMGMSVIVWLALRPQVLGTTTPGEFISYLTAAGLLSKPIRALTEVNEKLQRGIIAARSVFELLDTPAEPDDGHVVTPIVGKIEFQHVDLVYPDGVAALNQINLTIEPHKTYALVGRSGSGKTSLVNLITRTQTLTQGQLLIDGVAHTDYTLATLRRAIAMVGQQVTLFNATIAENIAYGELRTSTQAAMEAAAKAAYAHDFIMQLPDGYATVIGPNGLSLSGGQRQRLAIARALLKNAPILILDEATSALDNESEFYIQHALENATQHRTTIVIAHRLSTIEKADCIVVMDKGRIIEQGTHAALLQQSGYYAQLHARHFDNIDEEIEQSMSAAEMSSI